MLVLTRKLMEKLFIGDDICVTVVRLEGGQVRLGIDAPREVRGRSRGAGSGAAGAAVPVGPRSRGQPAPRRADAQVLTIRGSWNR